MKTISKADIIQALQREPLQRGYWVNPYAKEGEACSVCAVGAVLRACRLPDSEINNAARVATSDVACLNDATDNYVDPSDRKQRERIIDNLIEDRNYLGALSCLFEAQDPEDDEHAPTAEERKELIDFVENRFPDLVKFSDFTEEAEDEDEDNY